MSVIKINISSQLDKLRREFNEMMDELFCMPYGKRGCPVGWMPAVDIYEDSKAIYIVADVAGVDSKSLEVVIEGQFLRFSGNRQPPITIQEKRFFQMEVEYGPFERIVRIPLPIEIENIEAKLENGLLLVRLAKKGSKKMNIEIK